MGDWADDFFDQVLDNALNESDESGSEVESGEEEAPVVEPTTKRPPPAREDRATKRRRVDPPKPAEEEEESEESGEDEPEEEEAGVTSLTEALNTFTQSVVEEGQDSFFLLDGTSKPTAVGGDQEEGEDTEEGELSDNEPTARQALEGLADLANSVISKGLRQEAEESSSSSSSSEDEAEAQDPQAAQKKVAPAFQEPIPEPKPVVVAKPAAEDEGSDSDSSSSDSDSSSEEGGTGGWTMIKGGPRPERPPKLEPVLGITDGLKKEGDDEIDPQGLAEALRSSMENLKKQLHTEKFRENVLQMDPSQDPRTWLASSWEPEIDEEKRNQLKANLKNKEFNAQAFLEQVKKAQAYDSDDESAVPGKVDPTQLGPANFGLTLKKQAEQLGIAKPANKPGPTKPKSPLILLRTGGVAEPPTNRSRSRTRSRSRSRSRSSSYSSDSGYSSDENLVYGKHGGFYHKKRDDEPPGPRSLYVWGFPPQFRSRDLESLFKRFGCYDASVVFHKDGRSRCFGFVDFLTHEEATLARFAMNGIRPSHDFRRKLRVTEKTEVGSKKAIAREKVRSQMKKFAEEAKRRKEAMIKEFQMSQRRQEKANSLVAQAVRQLETKYVDMQPVLDPVKAKLALLSSGVMGSDLDYKAKIADINQRVAKSRTQADAAAAALAPSFIKVSDPMPPKPAKGAKEAPVEKETSETTKKPGRPKTDEATTAPPPPKTKPPEPATGPPIASIFSSIPALSLTSLAKKALQRPPLGSSSGPPPSAANEPPTPVKPAFRDKKEGEIVSASHRADAPVG